MKCNNSSKNILNRYRHAWVLLYGLIYMPWFMYLEKRPIPAHEYFIINSPLDKYIPFCEYFVIPYLFWFAFVAIGVAYFFFTNRKEFYQVMTFLIIGMGRVTFPFRASLTAYKLLTICISGVEKPALDW
jgi:hypothetical protein